MPKLPQGLFRRKGSRSYYTRIFRGGRDRWISLGPDFRRACHRLREIRARVGPVGGIDRIEGLVGRWLETAIALHRNPKGLRLAAARARLHLLPFCGHRDVWSLEAEDLRRYRLALEAKRLSPQTVAHVLADARAFLRWCEEEGLLLRSPFPRRLLPRIQERPPEPLTDVEIRAICWLPDPWGWVCRLGLQTGLRWGELVRSRADHVEGGMLVVAHTKTDRVRRVPLPLWLQAEIGRRSGPLVPFAASSCGAFARVVRRRSGVARFRPHLMRHTYATRWIRFEGSVETLQKILGHSVLRTTERYYRISDRAVASAAETVFNRSSWRSSLGEVGSESEVTA